MVSGLGLELRALLCQHGGGFRAGGLPLAHGPGGLQAGPGALRRHRTGGRLCVRVPAAAASPFHLQHAHPRQAHGRHSPLLYCNRVCPPVNTAEWGYTMLHIKQHWMDCW